MARKRIRSLLVAPALAALLACAFVAAGCGSSSSGTSSSSSSAATAASPPPSNTSKSLTTTVPAAPAGGGSGGSGGAAAVAACKQAVASQTSLSADERSKLDSLCDKAGSGNESAIKTAARKICEEVVSKEVPAGAEREAADKGCQKAG